MEEHIDQRHFFLKLMFFLFFTMTLCLQNQPLYALKSSHNPSTAISIFKVEPNPVSNPLEPVSIFIHISQIDGQPYTCAIDLGDGTIQTGCDSFNHIYTKAGKYNVTLKVTDNQGNKTSRTIIVTVKNKRPAKVSGLTLTLEPTTSINRFQTFISGKGQAPTLQDYNTLGIQGVTSENLEDINFLIKKHGDLTKKQIQERVNIRNNSMKKIITYVLDTKAPAPKVQDYTDIGIVDVNIKNLYEINSFLLSHANSPINSIKKLQALINTFYAYKWKIGARPVTATPVSKATMFADPAGNGDLCSYSSPCSIHTAFSKLKAGDVLFLRGGVYIISKTTLRVKESGKADKPIIIESFPGEWAILKGLHEPKNDQTSSLRTNGITISREQNYIHIRRLEIKNMGWAGVAIFGSNNLIEGCNIHHNLSSGIVLYGGEWHEDRPGYKIPYPYGYNTIKDNIVHDNSDASLATKGGNADGIAVSSGRFNKIIHNTVYSNSDDGIDLWRSNYSFVAFNITYDNGKANGDGQGIKAGGNLNPQATNGLKANVQHNISYSNKRNGFDVNAGKQVIFKYNTAWKNGRSGFVTNDDTTVEFNLAAENALPTKIKQGHHSNSWQREVTPKFVSKNPESPDFLRPTSNSGLEDTGAYANLANPE